MRRYLVLALVLVLTLAGVTVASAGPIAWVDWTSGSSITGTVDGMITPSAAPAVFTRYTGMFAFAQITGGGTNYWLPDTPYLSTVVSNAPSSTDIIALNLASVAYSNNIHFSTPVMNPVMAIVSMGRSNLPVYYDFVQEFSVLSFGPGYWGGPGTLTNLGGGVLQGIEGHGAIQFHGAVSDITWTNSPDEYWHGFTVGVPDTASVPDGGSSLLLLGMALAGLRTGRKRLG
jgi:hypothetical protein